MVLLSGVLLMGSTSNQYWSLRKRFVKAMTLSDPFAHSLPLVSDLQILKLDDVIIFMFPLLSMNAITILPQTVLVIILPRCLIFIITILEVTHMVTFFLREKTLYSMVYALFVLMEQKFGITSLLISKTLHQLETSSKR